jgi:hypothetical protein
MSKKASRKLKGYANKKPILKNDSAGLLDVGMKDLVNSSFAHVYYLLGTRLKLVFPFIMYSFYLLKDEICIRKTKGEECVSLCFMFS